MILYATVVVHSQQRQNIRPAKLNDPCRVHHVNERADKMSRDRAVPQPIANVRWRALLPACLGDGPSDGRIAAVRRDDGLEGVHGRDSVRFFRTDQAGKCL